MTIIKKHDITGVLQIQFERANAKNALSLDMYRQMGDALVELEQDPSLKVAVFHGDCHCFTAGNDLKDFLSGGELNAEHPTVRFLNLLASCSKPVIAAVAGPAIGIGTTMLLHCDLAYAANNSTFQLPFARLGLCPEAASSSVLPKLTGHVKAFELLVLGDKFSADTAADLGLVNFVTEPEQVIPYALEQAQRLAKLPSDAVCTSKRLMVENAIDSHQVIKQELAEFQRLLDGDDCKQQIQAFFNR